MDPDAPSSPDNKSSHGRKTVESTSVTENNSSRGGDTVESTSSFGHFWQELRQRKVVRAGIAYLIVGLGIMEGGDIVLGNLGAPQWVVTALILLVIAGFPIVLVLEWIYELTPQGIRNTDEVREEQAKASGKKLTAPSQPALLLFMGAAVPTLIFGTVALYFFLRAKTVSDELVFVTQTQFEEETGKSIAVLPLETLSGGDDDDTFTDGLHWELTSILTQIADIKTIDPKSTLLYRETSKSNKVIGRELGVRTLLTGTVQWSVDQVNIAVLLIDTITNETLWGDTFLRDRSNQSLFEIQAEISREIAGRLHVGLSQKEQERIDNVPTQSAEALKAYWKAKEIRTSTIQSRRDEAFALIEKAIQLDSEFTLAHVELGHLHLWWGGASNNNTPWSERISKAEEAATRALQLDNELAEVHLLWAKLYNLKKKKALAKESLEQTLEIKPNFAEAHLNYASMLTKDFDIRNKSTQRLAVPWFQRAIELNPRSGIVRREYGELLIDLGEFSSALHQLETSVRIDPSLSAGYRSLGILLMTSFGRFDEAIPNFRKAVEVDPFRWEPYYFLSRCFRMLGDQREAHRWFKPGKEIGWSHAPKELQVYTHFVNGDKDEWLERARQLFREHPQLVTRRDLLNDDIRQGRADIALRLYQAVLPFLFEEEVHFNHKIFLLDSMQQATAAMELAEILIKTGDTERGAYLLDKAWGFFRYYPREGWNFGYSAGYGIRDAVRYALLGEKRKALDAIQEAIDAGFRDRLELESSALDSLHEEPEFIAMIEVVNADWARQLENVRRMEANGELAAIPQEILKLMDEE